MTHRIRHAMTTDAAATAIKNSVFALVERGGQVLSTHITGMNFASVNRAFKKHVSKDPNLVTDEPKKFRKIGQTFASHEVVNHSAKEYARRNV
jgi:hypothetical protein